MKFLSMYFSSLPCYLVPLRSKYRPQHPITLFSDTFSLCSSFSVSDQILHPEKQQANL